MPIVVHTQGGIERANNVYAKVEHLWAQARIELPGSGRPSEYHVARGCVSRVCGQGDLLTDTRTLSISAWVDPRIEIAPDFARRDDFRLTFSAGVTPVPEPSSAMLFAAGVGVILAAVGRRRGERFADVGRSLHEPPMKARD